MQSPKPHKRLTSLLRNFQYDRSINDQFYNQEIPRNGLGKNSPKLSNKSHKMIQPGLFQVTKKCNCIKYEELTCNMAAKWLLTYYQSPHDKEEAIKKYRFFLAKNEIEESNETQIEKDLHRTYP